MYFEPKSPTSVTEKAKYQNIIQIESYDLLHVDSLLSHMLNRSVRKKEAVLGFEKYTCTFQEALEAVWLLESPSLVIAFSGSVLVLAGVTSVVEHLYPYILKSLPILTPNFRGVLYIRPLKGAVPRFN